MPQKHPIRHAGPSKPQLCGGKRSYQSKNEAEITKIEQETINPDLELSIYHCIDCGSWHLTRRSSSTNIFL